MVLLLGAPPSALGRSVGRTSFVNKDVGIRLLLPARWVAQERSALPGLVAAFRHTSGARLVLSSRKRRPDETASTLAAKHVEPLRSQGWTVNPPVATKLGPASAVLLEAADSKSKRRVFQIYAVRDTLVYVLTMAIPEDRRARLETDLRFIQRTTRFAR